MNRLNLWVRQTAQARPASTRDSRQSDNSARLSSSIFTMTCLMWTSSDLFSCSTDRDAGPETGNNLVNSDL